jgi:hypothetical protein
LADLIAQKQTKSRPTWRFGLPADLADFGRPFW